MHLPLKAITLPEESDQLAGNLDTKYKSNLRDRLTSAYPEQTTAHRGDLVIKDARAEYRCLLVAQDGWEARLNGELTPL